jgi:hypothetical protein
MDACHPNSIMELKKNIVTHTLWTLPHFLMLIYLLVLIEFNKNLYLKSLVHMLYFSSFCNFFINTYPIYIKNKHNYIIKLIRMQVLANNQYMKPYIFTHVSCKFKEECALPRPPITTRVQI